VHPKVPAELRTFETFPARHDGPEAESDSGKNDLITRLKGVARTWGNILPWGVTKGRERGYHADRGKNNGRGGKLFWTLEKPGKGLLRQKPKNSQVPRTEPGQGRE